MPLVGEWIKWTGTFKQWNIIQEWKEMSYQKSLKNMDES